LLHPDMLHVSALRRKSGRVGRVEANDIDAGLDQKNVRS
jgi:hypothetical protein